MQLNSGEKYNWSLVAEISLDQTDVANLMDQVKSDDLVEQVDNDINDGSSRLKKLLAGADAFQSGGNPARNQRHLANVLFNVMRGRSTSVRLSD